MTDEPRAVAQPTGTRQAGGRRAGQSRTREAILTAARQLFASEGAAGTSIRSVARAAGVDPALVMHYFGSKDGLFQAAIEWPVDLNLVTDRVFTGPLDGLAKRLVRFFMEQWENEATRHQLEIIVRGAIGRQSDSRLLREFVTNQLIGRLAAALTGPDADLRGGLVLSSLVGLAVGRYLLSVEPLATANKELVVALVAPTIQRYIDGDLGGLAGE